MTSSSPKDVFLSFKNLDDDGNPTRDSQLAREIYDYLTSRGLDVFFSNVSLEQLGVAEYTRAIDDALSYNYEEIPAAEGRAARILAEAQGYYSDVVEAAKGEADHFNKILSEYRKDQELTRYRLYMETIQEVLGAVGEYYILDTANRKKPASLKLFK